MKDCRYLWFKTKGNLREISDPRECITVDEQMMRISHRCFHLILVFDDVSRHRVGNDDIVKTFEKHGNFFDKNECDKSQPYYVYPVVDSYSTKKQERLKYAQGTNVRVREPKIQQLQLFVDVN